MGLGEVRGRGVMWAPVLVSNAETREPLAAYGGTSPAMTEVTGFLKDERMLSFVNVNRVHVVPPCNTPDEDVAAGLELIDRALEIADRYVVG